MSATPYAFIKRDLASVLVLDKIEREKFCTRFMSYVTKTDGCWVWVGYRPGVPSKPRYGAIKVAGRFIKAHRASYELFRGPIPAGLKVLHGCDNPPCVNPEHLHIGTQKQNRQEAVARGRTARGLAHGRHTQPGLTARGSQHGQAKLTEQIVVLARQRFARGVVCGQLAVDYGVDWKTMHSVLHGKTWKHVGS